MKAANRFHPLFHDAKTWAVVCVFILFFVILVFFSRFDLRFHNPSYMADTSHLYYSVLLTSQGARPYVDFEDRYTPGLFYLNAFLFNSFGIRMSVVRWGIAVFWLLNLVGLYLVARFIMPRKFALIAPAMSLLWGPLNRWAPWAIWYSAPFAIFSLFFILKYSERGRSRDLLLAGVAGGISFFFKQSTGALTMISVLVAYAFFPHFQKSPSAVKPTEAKGSSLIISLRLLGVAFGCFVFPLLLMRTNVQPNHILLHLVPLGSLGVFLILVVVYFSKWQGKGPAEKGQFLRFLGPPVLAAAGFFAVTALWFPIASEGIGTIKLVRYLFMLERPLFVSLFSRLQFGPPLSLETFAPAVFYLSLSLFGAIFFLRIRFPLRLALAATLVGIEVAAVLVRPELKEYMFSEVSTTAACMVFALHFFVLTYAGTRIFFPAGNPDAIRKTTPLLTILIFSDFFFLQMFPINSFIHLRWAITPWLVIAAWTAYEFYAWLQRLDERRVRNVFGKLLRCAVAVIPILMYFTLTLLYNLGTGFFDIPLLVRSKESDQFSMEPSSVGGGAQAPIHSMIRPRKFLQPNLDRVDVLLPAEFARSLEELIEYIKERVGPHDAVFGPSLNFINFAAEIPAPLSENYFYVGWVDPREELERCRRVALARPKYVIFYESGKSSDLFHPNRFNIDFPILSQYLRSHYVFDAKIGPFTVTRRK